ncbi:MAG: Tetratricopeptide 2 repeat protein [Bryobacterales bacterium]|jgi:tetratricopeptide (TPR) repeat protein|nr:Tetratricopeptide 2 repeat protein [Bryobacterales bacterium]
MLQNEDPQGDPSVSRPAPLVPISAEDYAWRKRRLVWVWIGAGVLVCLIALWTYRRSTAPLEAQQSLEEGRRLLNANRYTEAILSFDHALGRRSDLVEAYVLRGRARMALDGPDPGIEDFTTAIRLRPGSADGFIERASARLWQKDYKGVIADCSDAIRRDPKVAYAYTLRGTAFRELGNLPQALDDFNHAVELSQSLDTYFQRAATYELMGEHRMAISDLDQAIALSPSSPMVYLARAKSREAIGDLAGARSDREEGRLLEGRAKDR